MLGRTKDQIRTTEQVNAAMVTCQTMKLDGLVIIGGIFYSADCLITVVIILCYLFRISLINVKELHPIRMLPSLQRLLLSQHVTQRYLQFSLAIYRISKMTYLG